MEDDAQRRFLTVQRWADIVIERWEERIRGYDLIDTGALLKSFSSQVEADAKGDPKKVTFAYLYYGRFSDLGYAGKKNIKRKPWYSSVFYKEVEALGCILAEKYGYKATFELAAFEGLKIKF